jgi:hypothetical protein
MQSSDSGIKRRSAVLTGIAVAVASFAAYQQTAFRTITWWDNAEYSLAGITLGIPHPPGSLITTVLGWLVTKLPFGIANIFKLNLFAGAVAAVTAGLVCFAASTLFRAANHSRNRETNRLSVFLALIGAVIGALTFSFSETVWLHAVKFTPYVFTACLAIVIVWALLRWWEEAEESSGPRWLFLITLLFGLDFSVHRTNLLMLPGLFFWILLRRPQTLTSLRSWISGVLGFVLGLSFQLVLIPLAARGAFPNAGDPSSWSRFWDYITLKQYGGGWLVNLFPRKAPFFKVQVMDYLNIFAANFLSFDRKIGLLALLPAVAGLFGLLILWRRNWGLALGLTIFFLFASLGAVLYFNIPADFFRSFDRHYLAAFVIFSIWIAYGLGSLLLLSLKLLERQRWILFGIAALLLIALPGSQVVKNFNRVDGSDDYFTYDFGKNLLDTLPPDAIVFTNGDNDTWPPWYLQIAEGYRPDVTVINLPLLNTSWFVSQVMARDPKIPLALSKEELTEFHLQPWSDTTIVVPVEGDHESFQLSAEVAIPDSVYLKIPPTIEGSYLRVQDWLLVQLIINNRWKRPIYFSTTVYRPNLLELDPYLRLEGIAWRLLPVSSPPVNKKLLRVNLFERYVYRGYADYTVPVSEETRGMAFNLLSAWFHLAQAEMESDNEVECRQVKERMLSLLPVDRLEPLPSQLREAIDRLCE